MLIWIPRNYDIFGQFGIITYPYFQSGPDYRKNSSQRDIGSDSLGDMRKSIFLQQRRELDREFKN